MKTRIIKTKFWTDPVVSEMTKEARLLFLYLLTCPSIGLSSIFECPDRQIVFHTHLTAIKLQKAKEELSHVNKVHFKDQWILVVNAERHNNYRKSPANEKAYQNELLNIPTAIRSHFETIGYSTPPSTHKPEIINPNSKNGTGVNFS